jgi:hypothetical protein
MFVTKDSKLKFEGISFTSGTADNPVIDFSGVDFFGGDFKIFGRFIMFRFLFRFSSLGGDIGGATKSFKD